MKYDEFETIIVERPDAIAPTGCTIDDPGIAIRMSEIEVDINMLEMTELRVLSAEIRRDIVAKMVLGL
jgi:hypothetical protein